MKKKVAKKELTVEIINKSGRDINKIYTRLIAEMYLNGDIKIKQSDTESEQKEDIKVKK